MELNLNRKSQLPIHVQLKAQLTHLISKPGSWYQGYSFSRCANWPAFAD